MILEKKFTKEEINYILHDGGLYSEDDEIELFRVVKKKLYDHDTEKGSVTFDVVIKEIATKKFYKARLTESQWYLQDEYNAKEVWTEVKRVKKVKYRYEEI
jgi:hypothetical protein